MSSGSQERLRIQAKRKDPSATLKAAIAAKLSAKQKILAYLDAHPERAEHPWCVLSSTLGYVGPSFSLYGGKLPIHLLDRTKSLIGPALYVSEQYPQPVTRDGAKMYPVLQLDMAWINRMCGKEFDLNLLQVWGGDLFEDWCIREIPVADLDSDKLCQIEESRLCQMAGSKDIMEAALHFLGDEWETELRGHEGAIQVAECRPSGVDGPWLPSVLELDRDLNQIDERIVEAVREYHSIQCGTWPKSKYRRLGDLFGFFYLSEAQDHLLETGAGGGGCLITWALGRISVAIFYRREGGRYTFELHWG